MHSTPPSVITTTCDVYAVENHSQFTTSFNHHRSYHIYISYESLKKSNETTTKTHKSHTDCKTTVDRFFFSLIISIGIFACSCIFPLAYNSTAYSFMFFMVKNACIPLKIDILRPKIVCVLYMFGLQHNFNGLLSPSVEQ